MRRELLDRVIVALSTDHCDCGTCQACSLRAAIEEYAHGLDSIRCRDCVNLENHGFTGICLVSDSSVQRPDLPFPATGCPNYRERK